MLEEPRVIDEEYFQEFLVFYATTFIEHPPTATRLHFFQAEKTLVQEMLDPTTQHLAGDASRQDEDLEEIGYLGYLVLRPTRPTTVGECMLAIPRDLGGALCSTHCATTFGQTIHGKRLRVRTAPFIGQDETGVCAQAAIWGACKYLHKYRYYPKVSLPEITLRAGRQVAETLFTRPAEGMTRAAIYAVLKQLGFQIYVADLRPGRLGLDSPLEAVYTAIESGLPALLLSKDGDPESPDLGHAVWVVGHTSRDRGPGRKPRMEEVGTATNTRRYLSTSQWVDRLLVHDDLRGPYQPATIADGDTRHGDKYTNGTRSDGRQPHFLEYYLHADPQKRAPSRPPITLPQVSQVIVPLPEEVFVKPPDARRMALSALLSKEGKGHLPSLLAAQDLDTTKRWSIPKRTRDVVARLGEAEEGSTPGFAFRTYLCMSAKFREHVVKSAMCDALKREYAQRLRLPEYVWVTEIADTSLHPRTPLHRRKWIIGEVLIDSTDSAAWRAPGGSRYLALHVPGLLVYLTGIGDEDDGGHTTATGAADGGEHPGSLPPAEVSVIPIAKDTPYLPFAENADASDPPRSHRRLGPLTLPEW